MIEQATSFGGDWTEDKLGILERYLDSYTTALKNQHFRLVYIDAFAGSGQVELGQPDRDAVRLIRGSAKIAAQVDNKPFDRLVFVDKSAQQCTELEALRLKHPSRNIDIVQSDANQFIHQLEMDWRSWRGVIFLDPFATQLVWSTVERIAGFDALDMWILFPVHAVSRILPGLKQPDDVSEGWATRLNLIYGDDRWRDLYQPSRQMSLFGDVDHEREPGLDGLVTIYRNRLKEAFGGRFFDEGRTLRNSRGRRIFELWFCVGNQAGIGSAKRITEHILKHF